MDLNYKHKESLFILVGQPLSPELHPWTSSSAMLVLGLVVIALSLNHSQPHIVLIVGDDVGHFNVGYNGNPEVKTPRMDELAAEGARFDRMYGYFWCAPSRASLMSGRLPAHVLQELGPVFATDEGLPLAITTLAEKMQATGYATVAAGKVRSHISSQ